MRICVEKASGAIIEMQSDATAGTLAANAVSAGYAADAVEERVITPEEYEALTVPKVVPQFDMGGDINDVIGR